MPIRVTSKRSQPARKPAPGPSAAQPFGLTLPAPGTQQLPAGVSLCMIVKNEERFLDACLESARGLVDEICIVDTGSTDGTLAIAQKFGARVEARDWRNDFSWARNEALAMATHRWILVLDADEVLRPESAETLRAIRDVPAALTGLWVRCFNVVDDYKGTGSSSHAIARFFPNSPRVRYRSPIHEYITLDGRDTGLDAKHATLAIDHFGYLKSIVAERNKGTRNLEIIRAAVESHPDDPFHWYNLGTTALIERQADEGIAALERMRELVGDEPRGFVPSAYSYLADAYLEYRSDAHKAAELARESLKRSPHYANAHFTLGRALVALNRFEEAIAAYQASIADGKHSADQFLVDNEVSIWKAHSEIGSAYGKMGDKERALEWFDKGLANRPGVLPMMLNRARALESLSRYDGAKEQFRAAWDAFGDDQTATEYVNYVLRRGDETGALAAIDEMLDRVSPRCAGLLSITAAALAHRAGRIGDAEAYARRALELAPGSAPVLDAAEKYFRECGDEAAIAALRQAELEMPLEAVEDVVRRSSRWLGEGNYERALAVARAGRARFGQHPGLVYDAAAATLQLGDREGAIALLQSVPTTNPETFAKASFLRSVILGDLGQFGDALAAIDIVLAASPGNADATLQRTKLLAQVGREAEIEGALRAALVTNDGRIAVELAGVLMRSGRFAEAQEIAGAALSKQ